MNYYKGLYKIDVYNAGFFGGWRCGDIGIDGHYTFITDLKEFVIYKFGTYCGLTSMIEVHERPILSENEIRFCNDLLLDEIRRAMYNEQSPNLIDISEPMWETYYADDRIEMPEMWETLKHYPFVKHNISKNISYGDVVIDVERNETFRVTHIHDLRYMNKMEDMYILTDDRYSYFPELKIKKHNYENI